MRTDSLHPTFTQTEQLLGKGVAAMLWVLSAAALMGLAAWTGGFGAPV